MARGRLRLAQQPEGERAVPLTAETLAALGAWQARPGEILTVQAPDGAFFRARLQTWDDKGATVVPFEVLPPDTGAETGLTVFQAVPDRERFELVLQKLTELGVDRIVPMVTARSATVQQRDRGQRKSHKWPEVLRRAARQCRRATIPELGEEVPFDTLVTQSFPEALRLLLCERERESRLRDALDGATIGKVQLFVGPEGGFTPAEVDQARKAGILPVSLGARILRTETAAIVGAALIQHHRGQLG